MEEIYLVTLLLVLFAVAIFIIVQIPEVQDYILPPSGNYGDASGSKVMSNSSNLLSNNKPLSNSSNLLSNNNLLSNSSNLLSNNNLLSNSSNLLSNSNLLTGILSNDLNSVDTYLIYDLYNDGSVPATSNIFLALSYDKRFFLSYNQTITLSNRITTAIGNSNIYQTIQNVSDYAKLYILSNIPPINTFNYSNLVSIITTAGTSDTTLYDHFTNFFSFSNIENKVNIYANIYSYSANWYLNNLSNGLSNQNTISNYTTIINSYIDTQNFSNI